MHRKQIEAVKAEARRLLDRIAEMERAAGWTRFTLDGNMATGKPHPDDEFDHGKYTATVKRASMHLSRALVEIRR